MPFIYKITNKLNQKCYVGKTIYSIDKRWKEHCSESKKKRTEKRPLYSAMNKYGIESFKIEILEECTADLLDEKERYWIKTLNSYSNGYNATMGGDGKLLIDRKLVLKLYEEHQNIKVVSEIMKINYFSVRDILIENKIKIIQHPQKEVKVSMLDKFTNQIIHNFCSIQEAAKYLVENRLSNSSLHSLENHISDVCKGKRKTTAGYKWIRC